MMHNFCQGIFRQSFLPLPCSHPFEIITDNILSTIYSNSNIQNLIQNLEELNSFKEEKIEEVLRSTAETLGIKAADLIHPVRLALTGYSVSPSLFEIMELLGKVISLRRLKFALERFP